MNIGKNMLDAFSSEPKKEGFKKEEAPVKTDANKSTENPQSEPLENSVPKNTPQEPETDDPANGDDNDSPKTPATDNTDIDDPKKNPDNLPQDSFKIDDEAVLNYFKEKKGKELKSIDELFREPEPASNPFEGLSDEVAGFFKYHKETGGGYDEYKTLNRDYSKSNPAEIAREKAIAMSDGFLDRSNVDEYLEEELKVDVSDFDSLTPIEKMKLKNYGADYVKSQEALKEKYKQPIQREDQPEMVTLENGQRMEKSVYDKLLDQQLTYQKNIKEASDKIIASSFDIKVDDNGAEKNMSLDYEYTKDEVRDMASSALNIDEFYQKAFSDDKGLNYAKLQEGLHWADPKKREKTITAIVHKALAKQAEDFAAIEHNAGPKTKSMPNDGSTKTKASITDWRRGQGPGIGFTPDQF